MVHREKDWALVSKTVNLGWSFLELYVETFTEDGSKIS